MKQVLFRSKQTHGVCERNTENFCLILPLRAVFTKEKFIHSLLLNRTPDNLPVHSSVQVCNCNSRRCSNISQANNALYFRTSIFASVSSSKLQTGKGLLIVWSHQLRIQQQAIIPRPAKDGDNQPYPLSSFGCAFSQIATNCQMRIHCLQHPQLTIQHSSLQPSEQPSKSTIQLQMQLESDRKSIKLHLAIEV